MIGRNFECNYGEGSQSQVLRMRGLALWSDRESICRRVLDRDWDRARGAPEYTFRFAHPSGEGNHHPHTRTQLRTHARTHERNEADFPVGVAERSFSPNLRQYSTVQYSTLHYITLHYIT